MKLFKQTVHYFYPLLALLLITVTAVQTASAQKKRPPRKQVALPDSIVQAQRDSLEALERLAMPTLNLQEYTITGTERVRVLPSQRNPVDMADFTRREAVSVIKGRRNRSAPGAGGEKIGREFDLPVTEVVNEAFASFGKYSDVNAGLKYRRKYTKSELFTDIDLRRSSGHVDLADYYSFSGNISDIRPLRDNIQNRSQLTFNTQEYKFYGSSASPEKKRSGYYFDLANSADFLFWEQMPLSLEVGGRYYDPDDTDIFNWDLWSKLNFRAVTGQTLIYGAFEVNTDRVKDSGSGNAPLSDANYGKASIVLERLVTPRLHVKVGAAYYYAYSKNADRELTYSDNTVSVGPSYLAERKITEIYPQFALTFDMGDKGRFFVEHDPKVESMTLLEKLINNQYLNLVSPLSYENTKQSIRFGWRRSYVYDLSFEIYYNDRRIENFGIFQDGGYESNPAEYGSWIMLYDNTIDANEYRGIVTWNPHPRFSAWTSVSYTNYTIRTSRFAEKVPYVPNLIGEISLQFMPGWGTQFILDAQYIDERETRAIDLAAPGEKLDSYVLSNLTVTKQWNRQISMYCYLYNILNEEYQGRYNQEQKRSGG